MRKNALFPGRLLPAFAALILAAALLAADVSPQQRYVDRFAALAVTEMYRSGVPASITLAQGLLESRYGLSALAAEGHNHFGIKCHNDWKGKTMAVDDDAASMTPTSTPSTTILTSCVTATVTSSSSTSRSRTTRPGRTA